MLTRRHPNDHLLLLALDLQLSGRRHGRLTSHVANCAYCQARAAHLQSTVVEAERAYRLAHEPDTGAVDGRARLERALQQAGETWDQSWWARVRHRTGIASATIGRTVAASVAVSASVWLATTVAPQLRAPQPAGANALPVATLTPGAVSTLTAAELCAGTRTSRTVTDQVRRDVLVRYGMEHVPADRYELDALVTLDLGGTVEPANLWPQPYASTLWNAHVKDALEHLLADEVCQGRVQLSQAQREIATDWVAAYKRRFHTDTPMPHHAGSTEIDDDLEFEPPAPVRTIAGVTPVLAGVASLE